MTLSKALSHEALLKFVGCLSSSRDEDVASSKLGDSWAARDLLSCLEKQGVELESHWRNGFCGTCRARFLPGRVEYPAGPPLAYPRAGEVLPCCCEPDSDVGIKTD